MKSHFVRSRFASWSRSVVCVLGVSVASISLGQNVTTPGADDTRRPLQRGLGEALRGAVQNGNLGDSLRRGLGEAAQSAVETPAQTQMRDDQLRAQQQFDANLNAQGQAIQGQPMIYRDSQGRSFYWDQNGRQVFTQSTGNNFQALPSPTLRSNAVVQGTATTQGPTLGVAIESAPDGLRVVNVQPGSAAQRAGIQNGDIIYSVNGQQVTQPQLLTQTIRSVGPGQLDMVIVRNGNQQQISATLDAQMNSESGEYRAARQPLDGDLTQTVRQMQQQLTELQEEIETLRNELERYKAAGDDPQLLQRTAPERPASDTAVSPNAAGATDDSPAADAAADDLFNDSSSPSL